MCVVGKCFVVFYVFSFPPGVFVGTLNLIASMPDPSILTLLLRIQFCYIKVGYKGEISSFQPASETEQAGLCLTWSEAQIVGFLMQRLR